MARSRAVPRRPRVRPRRVPGTAFKALQAPVPEASPRVGTGLFIHLFWQQASACISFLDPVKRDAAEFPGCPPDSPLWHSVFFHVFLLHHSAGRFALRTRKPSVPSSALIRFVSSALVITVPIYARLFQGRPSVLGRVEYRHVSLWSFSTRYVGTRRLNFSNWYSNIQAPRRSGAVVGGSGEAARNAYCAACPRGAAPGCTCRICPARCDPAACPGGAPARPRRAFRAPNGPCRAQGAGPTRTGWEAEDPDMGDRGAF